MIDRRIKGMGRWCRDTVVVLAACMCAVLTPAQAQSTPRGEDVDPTKLLSAVVQVKNRALDNARSNETLGRDRIGTGVVIDDKGLVLTIGYLVLEPDAIEVVTGSGRTLPASLIAFDHITGFGLLRMQSPPSDLTPIPLGNSAALSASETVMILPFGGRDAASVARVMSVRRSAFSWEYQLDAAIYTSPPSMQWAGAPLITRDGRLVGIGSLLVRDTVRPGSPSPGNMFVPIDILKPVLQPLLANGHRGGEERPWLGLSTVEVQGRLLVNRVSPNAPAALAGMQQGDVIVSIAGETANSHETFYRKLWSLGAAGVEVPIRVVRQDGERDIQVKSINRADYFQRKPGT